MHQTRTRARDPERTKRRILDAAVQLFADRGYNQTSLAEVGELAGVSRATPGYFFGSKEELYETVLGQCFVEVREAVRRGRARALASDAPPEAVLAGAVGDYYDFLTAHPAFVRLIEREALGDSPLPKAIPPRLAAGQEALAAMVDELGLEAEDPERPAHFLVSLVALCWFPLVHANTLLRSIGLNPDSPDFGIQHRRHIIDLILHGICGSLPTTNAGPRAVPTGAQS